MTGTAREKEKKKKEKKKRQKIQINKYIFLKSSVTSEWYTRITPN